jgi:hypothetical protein
MILIKFLIAYFSFFVLPVLFLIKKYSNTNKSILLIFSLIGSFLLGWALFLLGFYLKINNNFIFWSLLVFDFSLIFYLYKYRDLNFNIKYELNLLTLLITLLVLSMLVKTGSIFNEWDAVVSWNRWAEELSNNIYKPLEAAYPILLPAIWSVFYKIQGTSEISWTVKTLLYVVPLYLSFILYFLYKETNHRIYVFILLASLIFILHSAATSGMVDMPVMLFGLLSFVMIIAFEDKKLGNYKIYYLVASILFAGLASITKQAGVYFLVMNVAYFLFFSSKVNKKLIFIILSSFISIGLIISYLFLFFQTQTDAIGNLPTLRSLSSPGSIFSIFSTFIIPSNSYLLGIKIPGFIFYFIVLVLLFFTGMSLINNTSFSKIVKYFTVHLIISFIIWAYYFSYSYRNALFIYAIIIILASIGLFGYFKENFQFKTFQKYPEVNILKLFKKIKNKSLEKIHVAKGILILILVSFLMFFFVISDGLVYKQQEKYQRIMGDANLAIMLSDILLKEKNTCSKVYTPRQRLRFNYYTRAVKDRIQNVGGEDLAYYMRIVDGTCKDGHYILFYPRSIKKRKENQILINELKIKGVLEIMPQNAYFYKVYPSKLISDKYD